jgi:O-antigen/teichoic acid export membrane protein
MTVSDRDQDTAPAHHRSATHLGRQVAPHRRAVAHERGRTLPLPSDIMRMRGRDPAALAVGSAVSGVMAYVFFALSTRALGAESAAPVSVLWTYWSFASAALTFPLQHWIARSVAAHDGEGSVHQAIPRVAGLVVIASLVVGLLAWVTRDQLFHRDDVWFPLLVAAVTLGSGFIGVVRGSLTARRRFGSVAWALAAENGSRCAVGIVLVVANVDSSLAYGCCLAGGALIGLLWPSALRFSREQATASTESALRFISGAASGQLVSQAVLTGGPVALALSGGSPAEVTALFAGLALFRAPYTLVIGLVSALTGRLTRLVVLGHHAALRRFRLTTLAGTFLALLVAAVVGDAFGPWAVRLIFGDEVELDHVACLLVALGSTFALATLVVTVSVMAQSRSASIARSWVIALLGGAGAYVALSDIDPLRETCWAFLVAEALAFAVMVFEDHRASTAIGVPPADGTAISENARRPRPSSA